MKGYIYTLYAGADPAAGWILNDPIFKPVPTLGACVPNIRHHIQLDDYVFAISGRIPGIRQYVVGGFQIAEKIRAVDAFRRFPENRLHKGPNGQILGNVIVNSRGEQHPLDHHANFANRLDDFLVGKKTVELTKPSHIEKAREETVPALRAIFGKVGERPFDIIGRASRLSEDQVEELLEWLKSVRR
ncbi:MAG TPA: hypothetical protein VKR56_05645 [Candidatus Cybelea sp.]|nr:hypothetical protein [Candidatus Cybelea sp.]